MRTRLSMKSVTVFISHLFFFFCDPTKDLFAHEPRRQSVYIEWFCDHRLFFACPCYVHCGVMSTRHVNIKMLIMLSKLLRQFNRPIDSHSLQIFISSFSFCCRFRTHIKYVRSYVELLYEFICNLHCVDAINK